MKILITSISLRTNKHDKKFILWPVEYIKARWCPVMLHGYRQQLYTVLSCVILLDAVSEEHHHIVIINALFYSVLFILVSIRRYINLRILIVSNHLFFVQNKCGKTKNWSLNQCLWQVVTSFCRELGWKCTYIQYNDTKPSFTFSQQSTIIGSTAKLVLRLTLGWTTWASPCSSYGIMTL